MKSIIPPEWNVLESEREFDSSFFSASPYHSLTFLVSTIALSFDFGFGVFVGVSFWDAMPSVMKSCYIIFMAALPIVWFRMRRDYHKMRTWLAGAPREAVDGYPVRMASHLMTFAPYYLYFLVFLLLFCFFGALRGQRRRASRKGFEATSRSVPHSASYLAR